MGFSEILSTYFLKVNSGTGKKSVSAPKFNSVWLFPKRWINLLERTLTSLLLEWDLAWAYISTSCSLATVLKIILLHLMFFWTSRNISTHRKILIIRGTHQNSSVDFAVIWLMNDSKTTFFENCVLELFLLVKTSNSFVAKTCSYTAFPKNVLHPQKLNYTFPDTEHKSYAPNHSKNFRTAGPKSHLFQLLTITQTFKISSSPRSTTKPWKTFCQKTKF